MNLLASKDVKLVYEITIISLCFIAICFIYSGQQINPFNGGKGFDGVQYYNHAEQIRDNKSPIIGKLPFINRIGNQFLIGLYAKYSGTELLDSALVVNFIGAFIVVVLLIFWLRLFIDVFLIRWILIMLLIMSWHASVRFLFFYPLLTDFWGGAWFLGGLLLLNRIRELHDNNQNISSHVLFFSIVVAIGNRFRESNATLAIALFFIHNPIDENFPLKDVTFFYLKQRIKSIFFKKENFLLLVPIIVVLLFNLVVSGFVKPDNSIFSYIFTIIHLCYAKSFPMYLLGIFLAYGPIVVLLPFFSKKFSFLLKKQELLFLLAISFFFGFAGGTDTRRIFFMSSFPIIFLMLGYSIKDMFNTNKRWFLCVLLVLQSISLRLYWNISHHNSGRISIPFFEIVGSDVRYLSFHTYFGHKGINAIILVEYLFLLFWAYMIFRTSKTGGDSKSMLP